MAVRLLQILVLEESGGRKHEVGVIRGVGEELLVNHGKQIWAHQPAHNLVMIWTNRRRIRVVDE